ncbi:tetratricopeptide repeat protein [Parapedobacter deserti]|uniref:Tetratricopeptide repeat protein n=1 Tax=Parapedobacter deserti TaxID=1912957 RepID=A0ABV7JL46_9SPHI
MNERRRLPCRAVWFFSILWGISFGAVGQSQEDFSGQITKYDSTFSGIGPEVYFLPPPPTAEEILDDRYAEKEVDSAAVDEYVGRMKYYHRMVMTGNGGTTAKYLPVSEAQTSSVEGKLLMAADRSRAASSTNLVADIENRLAMEYVALGAFDLAIEFFGSAMQAKQAHGNMADWEIIAHNLAVTYEYLGQLDKAYGLRLQLYDRAVKTRDNSHQAKALMELAFIKAKQGFSAEAERDIIRKVVPLFRRARNEAGRASAYRTLADIYTMQSKYPEAQWFLVQAKSIVDKEGLADQLPEIIFNLAETKKRAGNPRVAIEEYKVADDLARKDHMMGMQLAIQDALGNLYHQAGDYNGAALALNRYDMLKNVLFKGEAPVDN